MKTLLVTEFWGIGDLTIGSAFLQTASRHFHVTLLAKPHAVELAKELWPQITVLPVIAPWTQFTGKYQLRRWPWRTLQTTLRQIRREKPHIAVSARRDPRDHLVLRLSSAPRRIGFPRAGSQLFLTEPLPKIHPDANRSAQWEALGHALGLSIRQPSHSPLSQSTQRLAVIHSGAAQPVRVWPIPRFAQLAARLQQIGWLTQILCDPNQRQEWKSLGHSALCPANLTELIRHLKNATAFIGNDSGPGHLAAALGTPTFTIFGPQRPQWFLPNHPQASYIEGKPCPHKPCFDYCRFPQPHCLLNNSTNEVSQKIQPWLQQLR